VPPPAAPPRLCSFRVYDEKPLTRRKKNAHLHGRHEMGAAAAAAAAAGAGFLLPNFPKGGAFFFF
jgi:hypothetical protein